jgi:hypothetical protein
MSHYSPRAAPASLWGRFLAGVLAVITAGLGLVAWIALTTFAVHPIMRAYSAPLAERWWDSVANILFALVWLASVYLSGYFYQKAAARRTLWPLFAKVTLIEVLVPLLGMGIALLLIRLR